MKESRIRYLLVEKQSYEPQSLKPSRANELWPGEKYDPDKEAAFFEAYASDSGATLMEKKRWGALYDLRPTEGRRD